MCIKLSELLKTTAIAITKRCLPLKRAGDDTKIINREEIYTSNYPPTRCLIRLCTSKLKRDRNSLTGLKRKYVYVYRSDVYACPSAYTRIRVAGEKRRDVLFPLSSRLFSERNKKKKKNRNGYVSRLGLIRAIADTRYQLT